MESEEVKGQMNGTNHGDCQQKMLDVVEGLLKMLVDREKQIADLNRLVQKLQENSKKVTNSKPATDEKTESKGNASGGVVIVERSEPLQRKLKMLLQDFGYEVTGTTTNPEMAVNLVDSIRPGLVMIDFTLPDMAGLNASRSIKEMFPDVKVIIMSEQLEEQTVFQAIQYGADEYLPKPLAPARLLQVLKNLLAA